MCYSAQIKADYRRFVREYGAVMSLRDFARMIQEYFDNPKMRVPKAMTAPFLESPETEEERQIAEVLRARMAAEEIDLLQELTKQTERLDRAQQALAMKATKKAADEVRIATNKIEWAKGKLEDLTSTELKPRDARIFPGWYAPVMVMENGRRVVKPMRYQCRPAGKPSFYDTQYPGTYNARRDNLRGFGRGSTATPMAWYWWMRSTRTSSTPMERLSCWSFGRIHQTPCWWHASGRTGQRQVRRICCRLRSSPTTRPPRSRKPGTIAAPSRSRQSTSTHG